MESIISHFKQCFSTSPSPTHLTVQLRPVPCAGAAPAVLCASSSPLRTAGDRSCAQGAQRRPEHSSCPSVTVWALAAVSFCRARHRFHVGMRALLTSMARGLQASPWTGLSASSVAVAVCVCVCVCVCGCGCVCVCVLTCTHAAFPPVKY